MLLANKLENYPDWNAIEEWCNDKILPDAIPVNVREWIQVADQYDIIVDLYSKYGDDFPENVLGELRTKFKNSYKKSIFECVNDLDKETLQVWITFGFSPRIVKVVEYIWTNITLPQVHRVYAKLISSDLIPVQPMSPSSSLYMDTYSPTVNTVNKNGRSYFGRGGPRRYYTRSKNNG